MIARNIEMVYLGTKQKKMIDAIIWFRSYNEGCRDFRSLMSLLHENGYSSLIIGTLKQVMNNLSTHLSIDLSKMNSLIGASGEILMKEEPEVLFLVRDFATFSLKEGEIEPLRALEICCLAPDEKTGRSEIEKINATIKNTIKIPVSSLAWENMAQQESGEKISNMVKGLSTNGKLLTNIEIKKVCKHLRKDRAREILSSLVEMERIPFPFHSIEYLQKKHNIGKKALKQEVKLLVDCGAVSPIVRLVCPSCDTASPGFAVSVSLEELEGKIFCSECGSPFDLKRQIKAFSVNENARKALRQGLWLEEFVADLLTDFGCVQVQIGVMVDTLEMDIVAIKLGDIILVECKAGDVDFTDLTIFSHKVRAINPNRAIIVTTSKVLPNAKKEIESIKKREEIEIMQIEGNLDKIKEELVKMMERMRKKNLEDWMNSILSGIFSESPRRQMFRLPGTIRRR